MAIDWHQLKKLKESVKSDTWVHWIHFSLFWFLECATELDLVIGSWNIGSRLEAIQQRYIRFLNYKKQTFSPGYEQRCIKHHFLPLRVRRDIDDISFVIRIVNGGIVCPELLSHVKLRTDLLQ